MSQVYFAQKVSRLTRLYLRPLDPLAYDVDSGSCSGWKFVVIFCLEVDFGSRLGEILYWDRDRSGVLNVLCCALGEAGNKCFSSLRIPVVFL
jgi:hypothetical protein